MWFPISNTGFYYQNEWEIQMYITWCNASEKLMKEVGIEEKLDIIRRQGKGEQIFDVL